jgi:hypothetical protein
MGPTRLARRIIERAIGVVDQRERPQIEALRFELGQAQAAMRAHLAPGEWLAAEFQVFSQWNEDGLIQQLVRHVPIDQPTFVEFGVESYRESNTRFLLEHNNWSGVIFDGGDEHRKFVYEESEIGWRYAIAAHTAFLTRETINEEFRKAGLFRDIGLLSIDVDGNDYWLWEAIDTVSPRIVVCEFNSTFGPDHLITVPYSSEFSHAEAHYSRLYFGASLPALVELGKQKEYRFVGCESHGANAFFVREDVAGNLPSLTASEGWVRSRFRSSRNPAGQLTYVGDHRERLHLIADLIVERRPSGERCSIREVFNL